MKNKLFIALFLTMTSLFSHQVTGSGSMESVKVSQSSCWKQIAIGSAIVALAVLGIVYVESDQGSSTYESAE